MEKKWQHFRARFDRVGKAAEDVGDALELVGSELKRSYEKIRSLL